MLRIWQLSSNNAVKLRLYGQITDAWSEELRKICAQVLADGCALTLDFAEVSFLDLRTIPLIQALIESEVTIENCSRFVASQIATAPELLWAAHGVER